MSPSPSGDVSGTALSGEPGPSRLDIEKERHRGRRLRRALVGVVGMTLVGVALVLALSAAALPVYHLTPSSFPVRAVSLVTAENGGRIDTATIEGDNVSLATTTDGGLNWSQLGQLSLGPPPNLTSWSDLTLAADGPTVLVAAEASFVTAVEPVVTPSGTVSSCGVSNATVIVAQSTDGGKHWNDLITLTSDAYPNGPFSSALRGDLGAVLYEERAGAGGCSPSPAVAVSDDAGQSWGAPVEVEPSLANDTSTVWTANLVAAPDGLALGVSETFGDGTGPASEVLYALNDSTGTSFRPWGNLTEATMPVLLGTSSAGDFVASAAGLNVLADPGWPLIPISNFGDPFLSGGGAAGETMVPVTASVATTPNGALRVVAVDPAGTPVMCWSVPSGSLTAQPTCDVSVALTSPGSSSTDDTVVGVIASSTGGWTLLVSSGCGPEIPCGGATGLGSFTYPWAPSPPASTYEDLALGFGVAGAAVLVLAVWLKPPPMPVPAAIPRDPGSARGEADARRPERP